MEPIQIVQGEDKLLTIRCFSNPEKDLYDLTGADITVRFKKSDGTALELDLDGGVSVDNPLSGKFQVALSEADTALLKKGEHQSFEVEIVKSGVTTIKQFLKRISVFESLFN